MTLAATLALLAMPLYAPGVPTPCPLGWCGWSPAFSVALGLLPDFTASWTGAFLARPALSLLLVAAVVAGLWAGGLLKRRVHDEMRSIWYRFDVTRLPSAR